MTELHEATFKWPAGPSKVVLTGSFDNWTNLTELTKGNDGFTGTFHLPWATKVTYKYIVDDEWRTDPSKPQEPDEAGNVNNVYTSPPKPVAAVVAPSPPAPVVASNAPAAGKTSMEGAKDTAASVVSYMASGLGAAFASVTGIDPINPRQIPLEDDKANEVLGTIPVPGPDAKKAGPAPTIGTAHDPLVPEAPIAAKPLFDALAPIADEPIVLPTTSTITNTVSQTAATVTEQATSAATTVKESLPTSVAATYLKGIAADKPPAPVNFTTVPNPDAPEPYKEAPATDAVPIPNAPEPYKAGTNGTLPAEIESTPTKVAEAVEKAKETVVAGAGAGSTSAATSSTVKGTPPASPTKKAFPGSLRSERAGSISSSTADGTLKRKNRKSIFGKLKEVLTPEKRKREKAGSTDS